jgi:hypothetical protein
MMTQSQTPTLDDVLNEFMAEQSRPQADALEVLAKRYPQFQRELIDFAAAWAEQLTLPAETELSPEQEKLLVDRAMSHMVNVTFNREEKAQEPVKKAAPLQNLTGEAKKSGYELQEFAKACGLDLALVTKLNNRLISLNTIPPRLISHIGRLLSRSIEEISYYLSMSPADLATKSFLARKKPQRPKQQSFAEAIRGSSLSDAEKTRWLDEAAGLEER